MTNTISDYRGVLGLEQEHFSNLYSTPLKVESDGHDNANFIIPAILVSRLSTSLDELIQRDGAFVRTPILRLKGVDNDIFWRFFQFLYCGAYMGFKPREKGNSCEAITAFPVDKVTNQPVKSPKRTNLFGDSVGYPNKPLNGGLFGLSGNSVGQPNKPSKGGLFGVRRDSVNQPNKRLKQGGLFGVPGDSVSKPNKPLKQGGLFGKAINTLTESAGLPEECSKNNYKAPHSLVYYKYMADQQFDVFCDDGGTEPLCERKWSLICSFMEKYDIKSSTSEHLTKAVSGNCDFANVFVGHASMWCFAYEYSIAGLMKYALSQLAHELAHCVACPPEFVRVFGSLVRYVYNHCPIGDRTLPRLVAQFSTCFLGDMAGLQSWEELLKELPDYAIDLINQVGAHCN